MRRFHSSGRSLVLGVLVIVIAVGTAAADTIATFADPAITADKPLFTRVGDTLQGGWGGVNLSLITPITGQEFPNATFTMTDLAIGAGGALSNGTIIFSASGGGEILRIDFDAATLYAPFGFGASELVGQNVAFSGAIIANPAGLQEQSFAFSFANQTVTPDGFKWTASFTSSAIPEPAALALLALGAAVIARRRAGFHQS